MAVTLQSKYYMSLIFFYLINNARSTLAYAGTKAVMLRSQGLSYKTEHTGSYWPKGIVTYYLDTKSFDNTIQYRVLKAMNTLESVSCVRFRPALIEPAGNLTWINITNTQRERNCVHEPKFKGNGEITLVIGFDCLKEHEILHSILHAIGFKDEVSHPQRDQYIRVMWNNIKPEYRHLYRLQSKDDIISQLVVEYDPLSIMHFHDRAFSINGKATVTPLVPGLLISPSNDLSQLDKLRLRLLFNHECNKRKVMDMIHTCKLLLSDPKGTSDTNNSENERDNLNKADEDSKADEESNADVGSKTDNSSKADEGSKAVEGCTAELEDVTNGIVTKGNTGNKVDKSDEKDEESTHAKEQLLPSKLYDQYYMNELYPDTFVNSRKKVNAFQKKIKRIA